MMEYFGKAILSTLLCPRLGSAKGLGQHCLRTYLYPPVMLWQPEGRGMTAVLAAHTPLSDSPTLPLESVEGP